MSFICLTYACLTFVQLECTIGQQNCAGNSFEVHVSLVQNFQDRLSAKMENGGLNSTTAEQITEAKNGHPLFEVKSK